MARIYLSSTYQDLIEHREAVYRALRQMRHDVVSMEDYGAAEDRPLDRCLADVEACDVYVGLFAWRYGFVPEGRKQAITQLEYEHAGECGRPRLVFLAADDAPWPPNRMDPDPGPIRALRARLQLNHVVAFFDSVDDLASDVAVAVAGLLDRPENAGTAPGANAEFLKRGLERMSQDLEAGARFYWNVCRGVGLVGILLLLLGAFTGNTVLEIGAILVIAIALLPFATMISTRRKRDVLSGYARVIDGGAPSETILHVQRFLTSQLA